MPTTSVDNEPLHFFDVVRCVLAVFCALYYAMGFSLYGYAIFNLPTRPT